MATPPRPTDPRIDGARAMRALVLMLADQSKRIYWQPIEGVPTQSDALGYPTIFIRTDPGDAGSFLYLDPVGDGADIIPSGGSGSQEVIANNSGGDYAAGDLVYLPTWDATNGIREAVLADSDTPAKQATHVCIEAIADGATGTVAGSWIQRDVDTSGYSAADVLLYLTTTATTTNTTSETIPTAKTDNGQEVAMVAIKSATVGVIVWYPGASLVNKHGNASLQVDALSADATGRAIIEAGFFNEATVVDLFATDSFTNAVLIQLIVDGAFRADAPTRALFADKALTVTKLTGTAAVANVPAAATATLTGIGTYALDDGVGAFDLDTFAGLDDGEWAWLTIGDIANPVTIRDNAVGAGNIYTTRAASIVLAALEDVALVIRDGANYKVLSVVSQAGIASGSTAETINDHGAITPAGSSDAAGAETIGMLLPMAVYGAWAVDGDGARTNGGGLVGQIAALQAMGATYCKVYDLGTTTWSDVSLSSALAGWTANYQLTADAANEEVGDLFAFGFDVPAPEFAVDLSQAATWGGDGMKWTYTDGVGSRADLTVTGAGGEGYDNTDTTARDGLRSLQQSGAVTVEPPSDFTADTLDGQLAYWYVGEITALQVTQTPILNAVQHDTVTGEQAWRVPNDGNLTALVVTDEAGVLHTTQDVVFLLWDAISGEHRKFTWAQDRRRERITCTPWALTTAARLFLYVIQEDGAAEPTVSTIEVEYNVSTTSHQHAMTAVTVTPPAHAGMGHTHLV